MGGQVPQHPDRARLHGARRIAGPRLPRAHVVGEPADARRRASVREDTRLGGCLRDLVRDRPLHRVAGVGRQHDAQVVAGRFVPDRRGSRSPRALHRVSRADLQHEGYQARVPVPRRRAQGHRRVRERRGTHAEVGAAVLDRARSVRHQLPAHGDGHRDRDLLVRAPSEYLVRHRVPRDPYPDHCGCFLRSDPVGGEEHPAPLGTHRDEARFVASAPHDP